MTQTSDGTDSASPGESSDYFSTSRAELPALHPFSGMDVWTVLVERAATDADRPFLVWRPFDGSKRRQWTYAEFAAECSDVAAGMSERGVGAGDRVIVHLENCPEFLFAWFACASLKAIVAATNARSTLDEMTYFIEQLNPVAVITQPKFVDMAAEAMARSDCPPPEWLITTLDDPIPADSARIPSGVATLFSELIGEGQSQPPHAPEPERPLSIQFTSGSTSRPKGVLWTHANALWGARVNASHMGLRPEDTQLVYMPLFHTNALAYSVLATLWRGGKFVLLPKWSTSRFWAIAVEERCTWMTLMSLTARFLGASEPAAGHSFRAFGYAANLESVAERYGVEIVSYWGMTETISQCIVSDDQRIADGVIGRVAPEYDVKVIRADGTHASVGDTGELCVRGVPGLSLFLTYWNNPNAYQEAHDSDGFFHTGDLVQPNRDGTITYMDRLKDMLKVGGENVATLEIERAMAGVDGISELAVVGRPDPHLDQVPVAFVVPSDPQDATLSARIITACRDLLAEFKVPREIFLVPALPHSTINKVHKVALRELVAQPRPDLERARLEWQSAAHLDPSGDASAAMEDRSRSVPDVRH